MLFAKNIQLIGGLITVWDILGFAARCPFAIPTSRAPGSARNSREIDSCPKLAFPSGFHLPCLGIAEFAQACEGLPALMVQGDRGMLHSDGKTLTLLQKDPGDPEPPRRVSFPIAGKPFGDEAEIYRDVAQTLLFGRPFAVTPEDALLQTRVLDAIRASHENRESVGIPSRSPC